MNPFIVYQLKVAFCLMAFTGIYYMLFRKETFYQFNRAYLLGSLIFSLLLPLVTINIRTGTSNEILPYVIKAVSVSSDPIAKKEVAGFNWQGLLFTIYVLVSLILVFRLLHRLYHVLNTIHSQRASRYGDFKIISLKDNKQSFSFFRYLFMPDSEESGLLENPVLAHEMVHARQCHSADIMLIQLIKIFQWFNPFVYLTGKALQETHEYLADASVMELNGESARYKQLLLSQAFGVQPGIFSYFNYSMLKNRLAMMMKEKSPYRNRYKYVLMLPVIVIIGFVMCCQNAEDKSIIPPPPPPPPPPVERSDYNADSDTAFVFVDELASFDGGSLEKFREWVQKSLVYPEDAVKNGIFGRVTIQFVVSSEGNVKNVKILRGVDPLLDNEAIRVLSSSPEWKPAMKDGKPVAQQFVMPIIFQLK